MLVFVIIFFNDTATTEIYTLSLHDALPICCTSWPPLRPGASRAPAPGSRDRKSTRLNSSHLGISYAVFCLKKKKQQHHHHLDTQQDHTHNRRRNMIYD